MFVFYSPVIFFLFVVSFLIAVDTAGVYNRAFL